MTRPAHSDQIEGETAMNKRRRRFPGIRLLVPAVASALGPLLGLVPRITPSAHAAPPSSEEERSQR